jgi:hypothetical protein
MMETTKNIERYIVGEDMTRRAALERLEGGCRERGIILRSIEHPIKKCIAFFEELSLLVIASNCKERQIT